MYQEPKPTIGEVHRANTYGGQDFPARPTIPAPAAEVLVNRARASDLHLSPEVSRGLVVDNLAAPKPDVGISTELAAGIEP
jgi:hypothetical protein